MLGVWQLMSGSVAVLALSAAQLGQGLAAELTASRALEAAIEVLLGDPYGTTLDEVRRKIKRQERVGADAPDCGKPA